MKHRIMEVILSAENSLTKEEIDWAIVNIPNETTSTKPVRKFDHSLPNVLEACGFMREEMDDLKNELLKLSKDTDTKSGLIEKIINCGSHNLRDFLITKAILNMQNKPDPMDDLMQLLKKI